MPGDIKMPSGVPINKVRIEAQTTNPTELRDHAIPSEKEYKTPYYVTSAEGSNFRLGLFEVDGKRFVEPSARFVQTSPADRAQSPSRTTEDQPEKHGRHPAPDQHPADPALGHRRKTR